MRLSIDRGMLDIKLSFTFERSLTIFELLEKLGFYSILGFTDLQKSYQELSIISNFYI
jgi:hypothetical protein